MENSKSRKSFVLPSNGSSEQVSQYHEFIRINDTKNKNQMDIKWFIWQHLDAMI